MAGAAPTTGYRLYHEDQASGQLTLWASGHFTEYTEAALVAQAIMDLYTALDLPAPKLQPVGFNTSHFTVEHERQFLLDLQRQQKQKQKRLRRDPIAMATLRANEVDRAKLRRNPLASTAGLERLEDGTYVKRYGPPQQ